MKLSLILAGGLALAALLASAGAAAAQAQDGGPFRARRFTAETKVGDVVKADQREGGLVHDQTVFGPTAFDFDGDGDGLATGRAFSAARGKTYSVWAQAPTSFGLTSSYGGITQLDQLQSYRREADQASLRITIKEASLGIYLIVKGFKPSPFLSRQRRVLAYPLYMPEAYISQVANRLGAIALTLSDGIREATEAATGMAGGLPAALVSLREWADGSSVEVLAGAMRVSHSRAVRVADRLEAAGLARRESDPSDGRRALVWLEPAGRELAERALDARARVLRSAVEELDAADVRALERLLGGLLDATTVDARAAMGTCRLCDARACGHYEGACPVTRAADRWRASA